MDKQEKLVKKQLEELVEKDIKKVSVQFAFDFVKRKKRNPNDKEMLDFIKKAQKIVIAGWKRIEKNPKLYLEFVKKKNKK